MRYETAQVNRLGNRQKNQDRVAIAENNGTVLLALADGLGGHHGGEVAAQKAVECFIDAFGAMETPLADPGAFLLAAIATAHDRIVEAGNQHVPPIIPRTTCVVCIVQNGIAHWAHVGDSRLYVFRDGVSVFRTIDHSVVEHLFQQGVITEAERRQHPKRSHITRCLGGELLPEAALGETFELKPADIIIMCSDGLWDPLGHEGIGSHLTQRTPFLDAVEKMAYEAETKSYPRSDNISVAGFKFVSGEKHKSTQVAKSADTARPEAVTGLVSEDKLRQAIEHMRENIATFRKESNTG